MKILNIILILFAYIYISCKKANLKNERTNFSKGSSDTFIIDKENYLVTFKWNSDELNNYKNSFKKEDDFYIVMDDINYYTAKASECLKNSGLQKLVIDKKKYNYIKLPNNDLIKIDTLKFFDQILIKKNKEAKIIKPVDLLLEYNDLSTETFSSKDSDIKSFEQFTPKNYSILTKLKYDWNGDKIQDMIIVYDSIPSNKGEGMGKRPLIALLGRQNNLFKFWFRNDNAIPCRSCSGSADPDIELKIDSGKLQYRDISLMASTVKNIGYAFDKNLDLVSIDLEIEEPGEEVKKEIIRESELPKVNLKNIDLKKIEKDILNR